MRSTYETLDSVEYTGERTRRLRPPARLQGRAKAIFIETVSGCAVGHFRASDLPLLERHQSATKTIAGLALRLRLGPQSRSPRAPKTAAAPTSYYEELELEGIRDDEAKSRRS